MEIDIIESDETVSEDIDFLKEHLGDRFVNWVLNDPVPPLTEAQTDATRVLTDTLRSGEPVTPGFWAKARLRTMAAYAEAYGTSHLHHLRRLSGGPETLGAADASEDETLRAMQRAAVVMYAGLLLENEKPLMDNSGPTGAPELEALHQAILVDPELPFLAAKQQETYVSVIASTLHGGPIFAEYAGPWIISTAWQLSCLKDAEPSLNALLSALPAALAKARTALAGRKVRVTAVASLTGLLLPPDTILDFRWGRVRSARPDDHGGFTKLLQMPIPAARLETGEEISINDHGDVIIEVDVPFRYANRKPSASSEIVWPRSISTDAMEEYVTKARVGLLLALDRDVPPVVFPSWSWFIEPLSMGGGKERTSPERFVTRTATLLTSEEVTAWKEWIKKLDGVDLARLGVTAVRLLRAVAERYDATDRLIDAVICWEAIFGGRTEMTLRVSAAMARLLCPPGPDRRALRKEIADIYHLRSETVHGSDGDTAKLEQASRRAMRLAIDTVRVLVSDRPELIKMPSIERSIEIILD